MRTLRRTQRTHPRSLHWSRAALLSLPLTVAALTFTAPALAGSVRAARALGAVGTTGARVPGRGVTALPSGGLAIGSVALVVAVLAATVALAVIGWRGDRRRTARAQSGIDSGPAVGVKAPEKVRRPAASKPMIARTPVEVRARRRERGGDRGGGSGGSGGSGGRDREPMV